MVEKLEWELYYFETKKNLNLIFIYFLDFLCWLEQSFIFSWKNIAPLSNIWREVFMFYAVYSEMKKIFLSSKPKDFQYLKLMEYSVLENVLFNSFSLSFLKKKVKDKK